MGRRAESPRRARWPALAACRAEKREVHREAPRSVQGPATLSSEQSGYEESPGLGESCPKGLAGTVTVPSKQYLFPD